MSNANDRGAGHVDPVSGEGWPAGVERVQAAASEDNSPGALPQGHREAVFSGGEQGPREGCVYKTRLSCHNIFGVDGNDPTQVNKTHDGDNANHSIFLIYMFITSPCIP